MPEGQAPAAPGLAALLRDLFSPDGLRRWIHALPGGEKVAVELPTPPVSLAELAHQAALRLEARGMVDAALFEALKREFPRRAAEIDATALAAGMVVRAELRAVDPPPRPSATATRRPVLLGLGLAVGLAGLAGLTWKVGGFDPASAPVEVEPVEGAKPVKAAPGVPAEGAGALAPTVPPKAEPSLPISSRAAQAPPDATSAAGTPPEYPTCPDERSGSSLGVWTAPKTGLSFVRLSAGRFQMGSPAEEGDDDEHPCHTVKLSAFLISKSEVTQAQWEAVRATEAGRDLPENPADHKGDTRPVENVSWCDAVRFANALSALEGLAPAYVVAGSCTSISRNAGANGFRLPTEAQWEYAARAGSETDYSFGDDPADLCTYGNIDKTTDASCDDRVATTAPVCSFQPNAWGLCDLHGNVCEWVWDYYDSGFYARSTATDPANSTSGGARVHRGGSWYNAPDGARSASRSRSHPETRNYDVGFRLALPAVPPL